MHRVIAVATTVLILLFVLVASERPACAYVDPGTGFVAVQAISSLFAGFLFVFRRRVRSLFQKRQK